MENHQSDRETTIRERIFLKQRRQDIFEAKIA
jgi:hypothetical protein